MSAPIGNTFAKGAASGRPAAYKSSKVMFNKVVAYLKWIQGEKKKTKGKKPAIDDGEWIRIPEPITITGLCLFLGFDSRQSFYDYEKREEFSYIIKKIRLLVENRYELALGTKEVTGAIFALKNMGWRDKVEHTGGSGDDSPIKMELDLSRLTEEELQIMAAVKKKLNVEHI